jgi:hypothetical protein
MPFVNFKTSVPYDVIPKIAEYLPGKSKRNLEATTTDYFQILDWDYKSKLRDDILQHVQSCHDEQSYKDLFLNPANRKAEFVSCDKAGQEFIAKFTRNGFFSVKKHFISIENPEFGKYVWPLVDPNEMDSKELFQFPLSLLNANHSDGTPLIRLVRSLDAKDVVKIFLSFFPHVDPNIPFQGLTPLLMAVRKKNASAVAALLNCKTINVNAKIGEKRGSALTLAILNDDFATVKLLLNKKETNVNLQGLDEKRPLEIAILVNRLEIVQALLKRPDLEINFLSKLLYLDMLTIAINLGLTEIVKCLLKRKDLRYDPRHAYRHAVTLNQNEIASVLENFLI